MKKQPGKHLRFYIDCMADGLMPHVGLCRCAMQGKISNSVLEEYFMPENFSDSITFWASGEQGDFVHHFTPLRQTIVLFMAAINNEL